MRAASVRSWNPFQFFSSPRYQRLPSSYADANGSSVAFADGDKNRGIFASGPNSQRSRWCRLSCRILPVAVIFAVAFVFLARYRPSTGDDLNDRIETSAEEHANTRYWEVFPRYVSPAAS